MKKVKQLIVAGITVSLLLGGVSPLLDLPQAIAQDSEKKPEIIKLGRQQIGGYTVSVIMIGDPHDQATVDFDVKLIDAKEDPRAMRIWIGDENSAEKVAMEKKKTTYGATVKVPSPLADDAKTWVEIETASGTAKGSYSMAHEHNHKH